MKFINLIRLNIISIKDNILPVVFQTVFILLVLFGFYTQYRNSTEILSKYESSDFKKSIIYYGLEDRFQIDMDIEEQSFDILNKTKNSFTEINKIIDKSDFIKNTTFNNDRVYFNMNDNMFRANILDRSSFSVYKDDIIREYNEEVSEDVIKVYVVANDSTRNIFPIGKKFTSSITNKKSDNKINNRMDFIVYGHIDPDLKKITRDVYDTGESDISILFSDSKAFLDDKIIYLLENSSLRKLDKIENMTEYSSPTKIIFFEETTDDKYISEINDKILKLGMGNSNTSKSLIDNEKYIIRHTFNEGIDKIVVSFLVLISSIIVFSIVNSKKIYKQNVILKYQGAKNIGIILSSFIANIIPIFITLLLGFIYILFKNSKLYGLIIGNLGYIRFDRYLRFKELIVIFVIISILVFIINFIVNIPILFSKDRMKIRGN